MSAAMKATCSFLLSDESGNEEAKGDADVELDDQRLVIMPKLGESIYLSLLDILCITPQDYRVLLDLSSRERLAIFDLGYKFVDFVKRLSDARSEMILKYLLMNESIKKAGVSGDLVVVDSRGTETRYENCGLRLYESSVVFIPDFAEPIRLHYSKISMSEAKDYALVITTEQGERLIFSKMGREFEATVRDLSGAMNSLTIQSQSLVKDLVPLADPAVIRSISRIMKDGRAAKRADIESISPEVWSALEKKMEQTVMWNGYQYLKSIAPQDKIAVGIKRGLMGDLTGNYIWTLIPIYGKDSYGNAIALEAARVMSASEESSSSNGGSVSDESGGGNATYFFRIVGRQEYLETSSDFDSKLDAVVSRLNQLMLDINFRREPIFLTKEQLREPKYARYRYAVDKIPSLNELRQLFIGRVIHSTFDQWKSDVSDLLAFNVSIKDNEAKWNKSS